MPIIFALGVAVGALWGFYSAKPTSEERLRTAICFVDYHPDMTDEMNLEGFMEYIEACSKCEAQTWSEGDNPPCSLGMGYIDGHEDQYL